jgi:hypothetical protein
MRLLTHALAALAGVLLALAWASPVSGATVVPQDRVVAALVSAPYDWQPGKAREIASEVPLVVNPALYPFGGYFCPRAYAGPECPRGGPEVQEGSDWPLPQTTVHEYTHGWEFEYVGYSDQRMTDAFTALEARQDYPETAWRARLIAEKRPNDKWHWDHWLLGEAPIDPDNPTSVGLKWRYELVPPEHRATWMAYARVVRAWLPLAR